MSGDPGRLCHYRWLCRLCLFAASVGAAITNIRLPVLNPHLHSKSFARNDRSNWGLRPLVRTSADRSRWLGRFAQSESSDRSRHHDEIAKFLDSSWSAVSDRNLVRVGFRAYRGRIAAGGGSLTTCGRHSGGDQRACHFGGVEARDRKADK